MILVLAAMVLTVSPTARAQRVVPDVPAVDGGGLPTPDEIASHVQTVATPKAIIDRIVSANENAPRIASMAFAANLRVRRPLAAPPDCVFEGTVRFQGGRRSVTVNHLTPGILCLAVNRTIIHRLFEGKTRNSADDPKAMIGWIDYDRGLVIDATMRYAVGAIDLAQTYTPVSNGWVLTYQYVNLPSLGSTVEISYSKITLTSIQAR